jgi:hypothetical protein
MVIINFQNPKMFSDVDDFLSSTDIDLPRFAPDITIDDVDLDVPKKRTDHYFEEDCH